MGRIVCSSVGWCSTGCAGRHPLAVGGRRQLNSQRPLSGQPQPEMARESRKINWFYNHPQVDAASGKVTYLFFAII